MTSTSGSVQDHYAVNNLGQSILDTLKDIGKDINALTPADLAPVDAFHLRGRESTIELARQVRLDSERHVLDVGSGIGGSARYLASEFGCRVTGLDLTQDYCDVAAMLSGLTGLGDSTTFQQGSALEIPFDSETFDVVWTEHAQMNISDKDTFYSELARVLKPGGLLAFHDIFRGESESMDFPVPWAGDLSISFLIPVGEVEQILRNNSLNPRHWADATQKSVEWFHNMAANARTQGPSPLSLRLVMGDDIGAKIQNFARNLERGSIAAVLAVLEKVE